MYGLMTARIAQHLRRELEPKHFQVLYSHGTTDVDPPDSLGKLRVWYGDNYQASTILADLDIAVVAPDKKVIALIEIEETTNKPKVILGDVLATMLGSGVRFPRENNLRVGGWTTLIIMAYGSEKESQDRLDYLENQINQMRTTLSTPNSRIGNVVIKDFHGPNLEQSLRDKLGQEVELAIERFGRMGDGDSGR